MDVFEKENGLLYYPTFYEGLEQSKNVIYTGQEATQQILAGLDWVAREKKAKTFYLIGSDYIWPRTSMKIARKHIENVLGGKVVGEEYKPLGNTQFGSVINKIRLKNILNYIIFINFIKNCFIFVHRIYQHFILILEKIHFIVIK